MTVIYPSPIFGPVHSRRLGISLGINLLPGDGKVCSFDCIYCECGFNRDFRPKEKMPEREAVAAALETRLKEMAAEGLCPDVLTFAGNGEPTLHPHFPEIIADTIAIRDRYCPNAKVSVLSNATQVVKPAVRAALMLADNPIMKLDTVNPGYIGRVDRPTGHYAVRDIIDGLKAMEGRCIIQTMFLGGTCDGKDVDNTGEEYVNPWLDAVAEIAPRQVMIYTIDRETPAHELKKTAPEVLDAIGRRVEALGIPCSVSY